MLEQMLSNDMFSLVQKLFPIYRSICGPGLRESLSIIQEDVIPELKIRGFKTGSSVFDWKVPQEYWLDKAILLDPEGNVLCDSRINNLSVVGHSIPISREVSLEELQSHLYSLPEQPDAIPYVTSYYEESWGFCLRHSDRLNLSEGRYKVEIESEFKDGEMSYGELVLPGELKEEVLISTYLCHPSMANNELSGPVVASYLARILSDKPYRKYTYRFVILPETIGSLAYLASILPHLKEHVVAGYVLTCIGDDRAHSYLPSRSGGTLSDKTAERVLRANHPDLKIYPWNSRGSDERQFCAPGIDLPVGSIMKSKYWEYPEYHTSLDTLGGVVTPSGLEGGLRMVLSVVEELERGFYPKATNLGEPNLGKRGLYPTTSMKGGYESIMAIRELLTWADGQHSLEEIAEKTQIPTSILEQMASRLLQEQLLSGLPKEVRDSHTN